MRAYALRGLLFAVALAAASFCLRAPALALAEICPAEVALQAVQTADQEDNAPASIYGLQLTDEAGPRSVGATLALDTDAGWFTATVPIAPLLPFRAKMATKFVTYEQTYWRSRKVYVDIGKPVTVKHYFLVDTQTDDPVWNKRGLLTCLPVPAARLTKDSARGGFNDSFKILNDPVDLSAAPAVGDTILKASLSNALESAACANPFVGGMAREAVSPNYPAGSGLQIETAATVKLALDPDGDVVDAWIDRPSGFPEFDIAAVNAAKQSKYTGAISYCTPVPSLYLFHVTFSP